MDGLIYMGCYCEATFLYDHKAQGRKSRPFKADTYTDFLELEKEVGGHGMQVSCSIFASQVQFF
jgi:hypothetical protein